MKKKQGGQAIFELIIFLPILIAMISFFIVIGNAINGSINQQKILRGYFYYYLKGNSRGQTNRDLEELGHFRVGMMTLAWAERLDDTAPFSTCYQMSSVFGEIGTPGEECDDPMSGEISRYIKPRTAYGICSETFEQENNTYRTQHILTGGQNLIAFCTNGG